MGFSPLNFPFQICELTRKIAKTAQRLQIEALGLRGAAQIQKGLNHLGVQHAIGICQGCNMSARLPGQFVGIHEATPRAVANSAT